jgi:redox-sensitive bicupin YhaK (pirin superfamily)
LRALLYAGRPLYEAAVVARGPFVMNTEAEIEQAYADYRAGRFGPI